MKKFFNTLTLVCYFIAPLAIAGGPLIRVGSSPNNEDGDLPRDAWNKVNAITGAGASTYYVLNPNYSNVVAFYARDFGTPSAANGLYTPAGLNVQGLIYFTNANGFQMVSNQGTGGQTGKWAITNTVANIVNFRSAKTNGLGYPTNAMLWTVVTGTNGGYVLPLALATVTNAFPLAATNNDCRVETWGDDRKGFPGFYPFATIDAANAFLLANNFTNISTLKIGPGTWGAVKYPLLFGQSIVGSGRSLTTIAAGPGVGVGSSGQDLSLVGLYINSSNTIADMTISNMISGVNYNDSPNITNCVITDCDLGFTNGAPDTLVFPFTATSGGLWNLTASRTRFKTSFDHTAGVFGGATFNDCQFQAVGTSTVIRMLTMIDDRCNYTVNGGQMDLVSTVAITNAAVYVNVTNAVLRMFGTRINVSPLNGTNFAVFNTGLNTNIFGYYIFNGTNAVFTNKWF